MTSLSWDSLGGLVKHLSHSKTVQNMKDIRISKSKCDAQVPCSATRTYQYRKAMLQFSWHSSHRNIWWIPSYTNFVFQKYLMVSPHPVQPYWVIFCLAWCCLSPLVLHSTVDWFLPLFIPFSLWDHMQVRKMNSAFVSLKFQEPKLSIQCAIETVLSLCAIIQRKWSERL